MMPVGTLMIEHRLIERMISIVDIHVKKVSSPNLIDLELIDEFIDFLRNYADRCHHGKEEDILFAALNLKKLTNEEKKIFDELLEEHAIARVTVKKIAAEWEQALHGNESAFSEISKLVGVIAELYPAHIEKEDKQFFIPVMKYFTREEQDTMITKFAEFDRHLFHERYKNIVEKLEHVNSKDIEIKANGEIFEYECSVCGYKYDFNHGDINNGIPAGTPFEILLENWICPLCGASKKMFLKIK